jgi:hypothetical protein
MLSIISSLYQVLEDVRCILETKFSSHHNCEEWGQCVSFCYSTLKIERQLASGLPNREQIDPLTYGKKILESGFLFAFVFLEGKELSFLVLNLFYDSTLTSCSV